MAHEYLPPQPAEDVVATHQRNEDGFFSPLIFINALKPSPAKLGLGFGAVALTLATFGGNHIEADADLNEANTTATIEKIVWDPELAIDPATMYFQETLSAEGIKNKLVYKPKLGLISTGDVLKDFEDNKELRGTGQIKFDIPFDAIEPQVSENKLNLVVDESKMKGTIFWPNTGPEINDYTLDGTTKNFSDRSGFTRSVISGISKNLQVINMDTLNNTIEDLDNQIEHDMKLKGLEAAGTCLQKPEVMDTLHTLSERAIRANVAMLGHKDEIGTVTFINSTGELQKDTGQAADKAMGTTYQHSYALGSGNFTLDELNCTAEQEVMGN